MKEYKLTDKGFVSLSRVILAWCPLGTAHFCDGTPNPSSAASPKHKVHPCEYYVRGKCNEPHILSARESAEEDE